MTNTKVATPIVYQPSIDRPTTEASWQIYERALATTNISIAIADALSPDYPIIYCNPAFERLTGYSLEEVLGRHFYFLQGDAPDLANLAEIQHSLDEDHECQVVLKSYRKDGNFFWNELTISAISNSSGLVTHYMSVLVDVTEQQKTQRKLQAQSAAMNAAIDGMAIINQIGEFVYINEAYLQIAGYEKQEELLGKTWQILYDEAELKIFNQHILPAVKQQGKWRGEAFSLKRDGSKYRQELSLSSISTEMGIVCVMRDISERKQAEREKLVSTIATNIRRSLNLDEVLNTAVAEVRKFLETDRVVIFRFEPDWSGVVVVESVDVDCQPILGIPILDPCFKDRYIKFYQQGRIRAIDDIYNSDVSKCHVDSLANFQVRSNLVVPILQGENLWGLLIAHHCSDGRKWQESEVNLLKQLSVQIAIAIQQSELYQKLESELQERQQIETNLRKREAQLSEKATELEKTIHELQQTQSQLIQSEKMSSLGQLVAGVAHEINNPVNFIYGNITPASYYIEDLLSLLELYQQHGVQTAPEIAAKIEEIDLEFIKDDLPKLLGSMRVGAERIREIVRSLRYFSRHDEAEMKAVDIHEGIDSTLLILQNRIKAKPDSQGIQVIQEYGNLPKVECYPGQLNQVLMNILSNAIDALEERSGKNNLFPTPEIRIHTQVVSDRVIIRIADNGPGMKEDVRQRLFDPFFTTKPVGKGTGLGLSISYQIIVEKHGGQLQCFSQLGQGSEFVIEIPLHQKN